MRQGSEDPFVKLTVAWIGVAGSAVAALIALASMFISQRASRRSQRELENLKAELAEQTAEKNARRDYEYEARKRLYEECEPIMFFLYESSISAMKRVRSLARTAREGDLGPRRQSWLSSKGYYTLSTIYMLMAPLTAFKLIQQRLTLVDLTVDPKTRALYLLAKALYLSFTADFKLARTPPELEYRPNAEDWGVKRKEHPAVYWRQGLPVGRLDKAVTSLIVAGGGGASRCMSFGEFETAYDDPGSDVRACFQTILDIFLDFHPAARPVMWRLLITQLHIYRAIIRISEKGYRAEEGVSSLLKSVQKDEREPFDWRQRDDEARGEEVFVHPFVAAETYLAETLKEQPEH